jgi:hypothetical protein
MTRPDIVTRTVHSFLPFFYSKPFGTTGTSGTQSKIELAVNIDPCITDANVVVCTSSMKCLRSFYYLSEIMYVRAPSIASFPYAFWWVWQKAIEVGADFIFNLEDDWELLQDVCLDDMVDIMETDPSLKGLRLNAFPVREQVTDGGLFTKQWDKTVVMDEDKRNRFLKDENVFYIPEYLKGLLGFCGHPTLLRADFVKEVLRCLDKTKNPEKQIKGSNKQFKHLFEGDNNYAIYHGKKDINTFSPIIKDIGREWMVRNGYQKKGNKAYFTEWEFVPGRNVI